MKKLISSVIAVAALSAGSAFAQSADCQRGIDIGLWPDACGNQSNSPNAQPTNPYSGYYGHGYPAYTGAMGAGGVLSQIFGNNGNVYGQPQYGQPQYRQPQYRQPQYNPTRRDRDGDGVRNRDDRYPTDPRYR